MFNTHKKILKFYKDHVRLQPEDLEKLREYRDINLERVRKGLDKLSEKEEVEYTHPVDDCDQGSYAMKTINQQPENDYDLDHALIFNSSDLPDSPLEARKLVTRAIKEAGGNFAIDPKARTNAVTIWYKEGYHIDFAIYRLKIDENGDLFLEHAGSEWTNRDPREITDWYKEEVESQSPLKEDGATVDEKQMRRITQLIKQIARAKSKDDYQLPGGLLIAVLVSECYKPDNERDDIALYDTISAIRSRLLQNETVANPVDPSLLLTNKTKYQNQVKRLRTELETVINNLSVLFDTLCDETKAAETWGKVFEHNYWEGDQVAESVKAGSLFVTSTGLITIKKPTDETVVQPPPQRFYGEE